MAERVLVSTEDMLTTVGVYQTNKKKQADAYQQLNSAVNTLDAAWDGAASEAFKTSFRALYKNISMSEARMKDAIDELTKSAQLYADVESKQQGAMSGLDKGKPFA